MVISGGSGAGLPVTREIRTRPSRSRARLWSSIEKQQPDDWQRFRAESLLGASLTGQKKYAEAEPLLLEGYEGMASAKRPDRGSGLVSTRSGPRLACRTISGVGQTGKAAEWRKKIQSGKTAS